MQRIPDAIVSEKLGSQTIETDTTFSQIESPANGQDNPRVDDIYSFIEIKVKEVCRLEIEKLKQEASTSYSNETIASLWEENNLLNIRLQELESRNESLREEGSFENEALENEDRSRKHPNLENEAPKNRKRSTQNSKPVCPLKTRDSPLSSHQQQESSTITNRMQFKTTRCCKCIYWPFRSCVGHWANIRFKLSINWHHHIKGHVEIGYLIKFGALRLNRDQVVTLETWLNIHTNVCNFVTASLK